MICYLSEDADPYGRGGHQSRTSDGCQFIMITTTRSPNAINRPARCRWQRTSTVLAHDLVASLDRSGIQVYPAAEKSERAWSGLLVAFGIHCTLHRNDCYLSA